jgi:type VI secretion system secreted protein VgrG
MAPDNRTAHVSLQIDGIPAGALTPVSVHIEEAISTPRRMVVEVVGEPAAVRPQAMLRQGVQIDVAVLGQERRFEGIVLAVREVWRGTGPVFHLTIGSPIDLLALSTDCRIFQEMSVPEIVETVLKEAGFSAARIKKRLSENYPKLPSCTQYNETMLAFVSRLLEAEGAFWFFEDGDRGTDLVIGDSRDAHRATTPASLPFITDSGLLGRPAVLSLTEIDALRPSKVTLKDLDWQRPDFDLESSASIAQAGKARELFDHPGGYTTPSDGKRRAKVRMEALVASVSGARMTANVPGISAGRTLELEQGPRDDLAGQWVITQVVHAWSGGTGASNPWNVSFRALPKSVAYRTLPKTPRPRIAGPQTAIVTGPSGQEIHTDEHGRVKLKFPWDRRAKFDEKSSPWVRVAQIGMSGAMAIPRIGWEVLVEFEHGDPDRPVVVGRLYNATYLPPYPLPSKKTVSTLMSYSSTGGEGHNEIRLDDAAGSEHIHVHAQKDLALTVGHDRTTNVTTSRMVIVKADEEVTVKGNRSLEVKGLWDTTIAGNQTLRVEGERTKTVKKDERVTVNGARKRTIGGSHKVSTEANATFAAGGDVAATIAGTLTESADDAASIVVGSDMSVTVGGAKSETAKKGKSATTEGNRTLTVGGALVDVSGKNLSVLVKGKRTSTVGAAWTVTSAADVQMTSRDDLEITIGAALTLTGAASIAMKVGGSKVLIGQGGVTIDASKLKVQANGPAALLAGLVGSK